MTPGGRIFSILLLLTFGLGMLANGQQRFPLPTETKQSIAEYIRAKEGLRRTSTELRTLHDTASVGEIERLVSHEADARSKVETFRNSLRGKDRISLALAHLQVWRAGQIRKLRLSGDQIVTAFEGRRIPSTQGGESGATGGSTSATALAGATDWISVALEAGALAKESKGTVTTFRVNAFGVYSWLSPLSGRPCARTDRLCDSRKEFRLRGLSGAISIDNSTDGKVTSQSTESSSTPTPTFSLFGSGGQVTSTSVRYQFLQSIYNEKSSTIREQRTDAKIPLESAANLSLALQQIESNLNEEPLASAYAGLQNRLGDILDQAVDENALEIAYGDELESFYLTQGSALKALQALYEAESKYRDALSSELGEALLKPAATVEYVYSTPSGEQSTSGVRFLIDKKIFGGAAKGPESNDVAKDSNATLAANVGVNWYNSIPSGVSTGRLRDVQASAQFLRKLGAATREVRSSVSLAGYYQYQINPAILTFDQKSITPGPGEIPLPMPAAALLDSKGHIGIVQAKLTLQLTKSISIPLAVSWANRTELVKASTVQGQFGISVDFGNLFMESGGMKAP